MLPVAHYLINSFFDIATAPFEFYLNQWQTVNKECHIVSVGIFTNNGCLIGNLINIFSEIFIKQR